MTRVSVRDLLKDRDERARVYAFSSCSARSEFVVIIVRHDGRTARRRGRTDRYPKCRLAGLRAGMRCEPAITTTQCHPEEGNFDSKVSAARRRGDEKREESRILAI